MQIKKITIGALMTALSVLALFLASILQFNKLAMLFVAGFAITLTVIEADKKYALIAYVATSVLAFFVVPDKIVVAMFILLAGHYPIVKNWIEARKNLKIEWLYKNLVFFSIGAIACLGSKLFMSKSIETTLAYAVIFVLVVLGMTVYDFVLSLVINAYVKRFRDIILRKKK